jgi:ubiquinone/menaquinone biosynthesis C-methylase UbiE
MEFTWQNECAKKWDQMSVNWIQNSQEMWEQGSRKKVMPLFMRHIPVTAGQILDAGCGDGYGSWKLAANGYVVTGIDFSSEMIDEAQKRESEALDLSFQHASILTLPFPDQTFAGVLSINCLEWVEKPLEGLLELHRILDSGGKLCLGVLGPTAAPRQHSYRRLYGEHVICNTMMPWECGRLAEEAGFKIIDQEGVYKRDVEESMVGQLSVELKQAVSFLWLFILEKL